MFREYAGEKAKEIVRRYIDGEINARECLTQVCAAMGSLSREEFIRFVDRFDIDPHFPEFIRFCEEREIPVTILSDGLDAYVERVLNNYKLGRLVWFANHVEFVEQDGATRLVPSFPYRDAECERCGNCKRNHLLTMSGDEDVIVYVGDGISDECPVRYADVVFAKDGLVPYCQKQNITYHTYDHFGDVQSRLQDVLGHKRIKQRREAVMARRDVFMQG